MPRNPTSSQLTTPSGSQTEITDVQSPSSNSDAQQPQITGTLRLRGYRTDTNGDGTQGRRIRWAEDVVDNEGQGKKSSKVCCIYHPPRVAGEDSSESDSDSSSSSSDSDEGSSSDQDNGDARMSSGSASRRGQDSCHGHDHGHERGNHDKGRDDRSKAKKRPRRKPAPNAYERFPRQPKKPHNQT